MAITWPLIFFALAAGFYLPVILWPSMRKELAGLFIPGSILLSLGVIFLYNTITNDWASWAYAWLLVNGGVGLGIILAAWIGEWGRDTMRAGIWMLIVCLAAFGFFATLFGGPVLKVAGPLLIIGFGTWILLRSFRHSE
jgi:hypothetical protein